MSKEVILKTHTSGNYYYPIHIVLNNLGDGDITDLVRDANVKWGCGIKNISTLSREIRAVLKEFGATDVSILRSSNDFDLSVSRRVKKLPHGPCTFDGHVVKAVSDRIRCYKVSFKL